jgi:hypothetical protein
MKTELQAAIIAFDNFLNEPERMGCEGIETRAYRHTAYKKWETLSATIAKMQTEITQKDELLRMAQGALEKMQWYIGCDTLKSVLMLAAVHGFGPTEETPRIVKAFQEMNAALSVIDRHL